MKNFILLFFLISGLNSFSQINRIEVNTDFINISSLKTTVSLYQNNVLYRPIEELHFKHHNCRFDSIPSGKYHLIIKHYSRDTMTTTVSNFYIQLDSSEVCKINDHFSEQHNEAYEVKERRKKQIDRDFWEFELLHGNNSFFKENEALNMLQFSAKKGYLKDIVPSISCGYNLGLGMHMAFYNQEQMNQSSSEATRLKTNTDWFVSGEAFIRFQHIGNNLNFSANDPIAFQLGIKYQAPFINRQTSYQEYNKRSVQRYFSKYTDFSFNSTLSFYKIGFVFEYHPFDLYWGDYTELSKFRIGLKWTDFGF